MNKKFLCLVKFVIGLSFVVGASATALGEEFYKGKTILFIVGFAPGEVSITIPGLLHAILANTFPGTPRP